MVVVVVVVVASVRACVCMCVHKGYTDAECHGLVRVSTSKSGIMGTH